MASRSIRGGVRPHRSHAHFPAFGSGFDGGLDHGRQPINERPPTGRMDTSAGYGLSMRKERDR